jgi:hypothetical protein
VEDCSSASDDDCDGSLNGTSMSNCTLWYPDVDADGYGSTVGGSACQCEGSGAYTAPTSDDCDDGSNSRHPGAPETCDAADDDCDGTADEGLPLYYVDADGDRQGSGTGSCSLTGRVATGGDCDDADPNLYTGAPELCDNRLNDCGDTGWTLADEDGVASIEYVGVEVWDDVTAYASGGVDGAPAGIGVSIPATFHWCPGTWYVNVSFAAGSGDIAADAPHGVGTTFLDGGGVGRVFAANGPDASLTLTDLTLQDGVATSGGLVSSDSADVTLTGVTLTGGAASGYGGGIALNDATLTLTDVEVRDCTAEGSGGGLYVSGDLVADGVLFTDNEVTGTSSAAAVGGAIATHTTDGLVSINNGLFERNGVAATVSSTAGGGSIAIEMSGAGAVVLDAVEVTDSYALSSDLAYGGGVSIATGSTTTADLSNVDVSYSYASGTTLASGGGLYLGVGSTAGLSVTGGVWNQNATYSDGTSQGGGAMYSGAGGTAGLAMDGTEVTAGWTYDSAGLSGSGGGLALFFGGEPGILTGVHLADCGAATGAGIYAEVGSSSAFYLQDESLVEGSTGSGVHLYAPSGNSVAGIISSVVRDNTTNGVEIGAAAGASVSLTAYGATGVSAGFLGNGGYGLYSGCGSGYAGTCQAVLNVWDLGDSTTSDDNGTDVYFFSRIYDGYGSDASLACTGSRCS